MTQLIVSYILFIVLYTYFTSRFYFIIGRSKGAIDDKIPQNIDRVAITITIYEAQKLKQNFGQVSNLLVHIINEVNGTELFSFDLSQGLSVENALVVGELYRHNGHWKFYANGSGFHGGLEALCRNFGIDVSSDTEPPPSVPVIQPSFGLKPPAIRITRSVLLWE